MQQKSICLQATTVVCVLPGYLALFCQSLMEELDRIPGDLRTQIGFITFDRSLHFYNLDEDHSQPQMLVVSDVDGQRHLGFFFSVRYTFTMLILDLKLFQVFSAMSHQ